MKLIVVTVLLTPLLLNCGCQGANQNQVKNKNGVDGRPSRSLRDKNLLNRGVYIPDKRFNAFVDGVMVNMVTELQRRRLDPVYFRVTENGEVEHVPTHGGALQPTKKRAKRESSGNSLGGGVIKGLSVIKRFLDASVQIAGNITLVRSSWIMGPLSIIVDYRGEPTITRVRTQLQAVQFDTLTSVDRFGATKEQFRINLPLFDYMGYFGNRTLTQQKLTELVVRYLFSESSFVAGFLDDAFTVASFDKIIPQFGAGDNYFSVLEYLFNGQQGRVSKIPEVESSENKTAKSDKERNTGTKKRTIEVTPKN